MSQYEEAAPTLLGDHIQRVQQWGIGYQQGVGVKGGTTAREQATLSTQLHEEDPADVQRQRKSAVGRAVNVLGKRTGRCTQSAKQPVMPVQLSSVYCRA